MSKKETSALVALGYLDNISTIKGKQFMTLARKMKMTYLDLFILLERANNVMKADKRARRLKYL